MQKSHLFFILCSLCSVPTVFAQVDMTSWGVYAESLQTCNPGTFNLPDPTAVTAGADVTFQIVGMTGNSCQVNIIRNVNLPGKQTPIAIVLNCSIVQNNLPILAKAAKDLSTGTAISTGDTLSKIIRSSCKQATSAF